MTMQLNPYLRFQNDAREAMTLYEQVFGGEPLAKAPWGDHVGTGWRVNVTGAE